MLRATFAPFLEKSTATFEVAYAAIERPADGREVPALRWADIGEPDYGVSLLNNCKYGHQAHGNSLGLQERPKPALVRLRRQAPQQPRHTHEAQPETRREDREWVE